MPVVVALALVAALAAVVFLSAKRRASTWLMLSAVALAAVGVALWTHAPLHRHVSTGVTIVSIRVADSATRSQPATRSAGTSASVALAASGLSADPRISGSEPNHAPAIVVFAIGGSAGLLGLVLRRRPARSTPN